MQDVELKQDVKEIRNDVVAIRVMVEKNSVSLDHHIKRTDLAEDRIAKVENWILGLLTSVSMSVVYYFLKQ